MLRRVEWAFLAFFLLLALAAYASLQRVIVHGRSMEPTLHDGDALVAWKLMPRDKLRAGDVIVFRDADGSELIKRIVFVQNAQGTAAAAGTGPNSRQRPPVEDAVPGIQPGGRVGRVARNRRPRTRSM